jgi:glycosyltransferase involved in cell wall biosynthesis
MTFFSIILPTYNAGSTIEAALDSILSQTFRDFELIIIDGLSSDNTLVIASLYTTKDPRIKISSEADEGIYDAMNKGIQRANGEWIYFIGADDGLHNMDCLQKVYEFITAKNSGKVFYGNALISGDTNWAYDGQIYDGAFDLEKLIEKNICHQAIFYNLDFIKTEVGIFNKKYPICADWDFNLRCWSKSAFIFMDLIVAQFNAGGESTVTSEDMAFSEDLIPNILTYFKISPFNEIVNRQRFPQYGKVLDLQKQKSYPHYLFDRIRKKIIH